MAAYGLVALVFTWPLVLNFNRAVPGQTSGDVWQMVWNLWWVRYALEHGQNPFETHLMFYPQGTGLYLHALNALNGFFSLPVQYLGGALGGAADGAVAGYNFIVFFNLVVGAYGSFCLTRYLWRDWRPALIAGLGYGFCTYQFAHLLGHLNLVSSEIIPFYCMFYLKALHRVSKKNERHHKRFLITIISPVACLVAMTFLELQYVLYMAIFSGLYLLYITIDCARRKWTRQSWNHNLWSIYGRAGGIAGLFILFTLPFTLPMLQEALSNPNTVPLRQERIYSADLLAYFYPSPFHPLWGRALEQAIRPFTANLLEKVVFPGFTLYVLSITGGLLQVFSRKPQRAVGEQPVVTNAESSIKPAIRAYRAGADFWLIALLVFTTLSFGPRLHINGVEWGPLLPGAVLYELPILNITRVPSRFALVAVLALGILAGWGLVKLRQRLSTRPLIFTILLWAAGLGLAFELLPAPYPLATYDVPPFYYELARQPGNDYSIMEVPFNYGKYQYETQYLKAQLTHRKPIMNGYISRNPMFPPYYGLPVFKNFRDLSLENKQDILPASPLEANTLRNFGVRYIVIRKDLLAGRERESAFEIVTRLLPGQSPLYNSPELTAYEVPPGSKADFIYNLVLPDWYEVEQAAGGNVSRWTRNSKAGLDFWSGTTRKLTLEFPALSFQSAHQVEFKLNGRVVGHAEIGLEPTNIKLELDLQPGQNRLELDIKGPANRPSDSGLSDDNRNLTISVGTIKFS